jgi:hypothetical protein
MNYRCGVARGRNSEHTPVQRSERSSKKRPKFIGQLTGFTEWSVVMDYDKMKALMGASREESPAQRKPEVKELSKPDSRPDWKYLGYVAKERIAV